MYITFSVSFSDNKYKYPGVNGSAETQIEVPEYLIDNLEYGNVLEFLAKSAYIDYKHKQEEKEE